MTTTTRTTRERTAKVLTAVLAVLGVLIAMLTVTAPVAYAADGGGGPDKVTICHYVHGNGETKDGYNIITVSENAWAHGHGEYVDNTGGAGSWVHDQMDSVYDGQACPVIPPYTTTVSDSGTLTICFSSVTYPDVAWDTGKVTGTSATSQAEADADAAAKLATAVTEAKALAVEPYPGYTDGACTYGKSGELNLNYCVAGTAAQQFENVTVSVTGFATQALADEAYGTAVTVQTTAFYGTHTAVPTGGVCPTGGGGGGGGGGETPSQPVLEPATVTAPQPATVTAPEPATVAVPAQANVPVPATIRLPATVPAGDGSSTPTVPLAALVLLGLATVGAVATGLHLATGTATTK